MSKLRHIFCALSVLVSLSGSAGAAENSRHILIYGDSIAWGWVPTDRGFPTTRYPEAQRWPSILAADLGRDYTVAVNAVSGRTTDVDYAQGMGTLTGADFNGLKGLEDAIAAEMPIDLVIVFLGTNDLRSDVGRTPAEIAAGAIAVATMAKRSTGVATTYPPPNVLVVTPPPIGDVSKTPIRDLMARAEQKSHGLSAAYAAAAAKAGVPLFDAGTATTTDGIDGIHFTPDDNSRFAHALAPVVRALLKP
jgi:lysophospholipase L1-like esterase